MSKIVVNAFLVIMAVFTTNSWAECTKDEAIQAETNAATLKGWSEIHEAFKQFSNCDDGAIAEGYSESVSQMLANHWDQAEDLEKQIKGDKKFEDFVIKHVDQTISKEDSSKILENAQDHCPKGGKKLCKRIVKAVNNL